MVLVTGARDSSMLPHPARTITTAMDSAMVTLFDVNPFHRQGSFKPSYD
jgi:hypothetical protein